MKTLEKFQHFTPQTVAEAILLMQQYGKDARLLAGGTDLVPMMKDRTAVPKYIIDLKRIPSLNSVRHKEDGTLSIEALTKVSDILGSAIIKKDYTALHQAALSFATPQVKNMATIGGNICRSVPSGDMIPPLLVFDARLKLMRQGGEREVPLDGFITGPEQNILNGEILTEINIPPQKSSAISAFKKVGKTSEDLAVVSCAVMVATADGRFKEVRIALGAVAPIPVRAKRVEQALSGKEMSRQVVEEAAMVIADDISPRTKHEYKVHTSQMLIKELLGKAISKPGRDSIG